MPRIVRYDRVRISVDRYIQNHIVIRIRRKRAVAKGNEYGLSDGIQRVQNSICFFSRFARLSQLLRSQRYIPVLARKLVVQKQCEFLPQRQPEDFRRSSCTGS